MNPEKEDVELSPIKSTDKSDFFYTLEGASNTLDFSPDSTAFYSLETLERSFR